MHFETVQQVGRDHIELKRSPGFGGCRPDAVDGGGIQVWVHASNDDITSLALIVFHTDACETAQRFSDVLVGELADGVRIEHGNQIVGGSFLVERTGERGCLPDNDDLFKCRLRGRTDDDVSEIDAFLRHLDRNARVFGTDVRNDQRVRACGNVSQAEAATFIRRRRTG